jgi:hypothetical protein
MAFILGQARKLLFLQEKLIITCSGVATGLQAKKYPARPGIL